MRFDGSRVWITGASSGIGSALAREIAGRGARVAISARRAERLEQVAAGTDMVPVTADVSDRESVLAAERTARGELGGIDMAILRAASSASSIHGIRNVLAAVRSVRTNPGHTADTRTPSGSRSMRRDSSRLIWAAFVEPYPSDDGKPR